MSPLGEQLIRQQNCQSHNGSKWFTAVCQPWTSSQVLLAAETPKSAEPQSKHIYYTEGNWDTSAHFQRKQIQQARHSKGLPISREGACNYTHMAWWPWDVLDEDRRLHVASKLTTQGAVNSTTPLRPNSLCFRTSRSLNCVQASGLQLWPTVTVRSVVLDRGSRWPNLLHSMPAPTPKHMKLSIHPTLDRIDPSVFSKEIIPIPVHVN